MAQGTRSVLVVGVETARFASLAPILKQAGVDRASHLLVTLPHSLNRIPLIMAARELNPSLRILVRAGCSWTARRRQPGSS